MFFKLYLITKYYKARPGKYFVGYFVYFYHEVVTCCGFKGETIVIQYPQTTSSYIKLDMLQNFKRRLRIQDYIRQRESCYQLIITID